MCKKTRQNTKINNCLKSTPKQGLGVVEFLFSVLVIAIISAMTIPGIIYKTKGKFNKTDNINNQSTQSTDSVNANTFDAQKMKMLYKNAYTDASQAWHQLYGEGVLQSRPGWTSDQSNYDNFTQFMGKFNVIKQCTYPDNSNCWAKNETEQVVSGHPDFSEDRCFIDTTGRSWCEAASQGWFLVDVNGRKDPNKFGQDRFIFYTIIGNDINASGIPDKIVYDDDCKTFDENKCPNPPCNYTSWILDN